MTNLAEDLYPKVRLNFQELIQETNYKIRNKKFIEYFAYLGLDLIDIPEHGVPQIGKPDPAIPNPKNWINQDTQPPFVPGWTAEDYEKLVPDFEDPFEVTVTEHDDILVVRDDLIPNNLGSKARYAAALMSQVKETFLFYAMVPQGQALKVLAKTAQRYNKIIVGIAPWRKEPTIAHIEAMEHGAILLYYRTGGMAGARKRCRDFISKYIPSHGLYIPAGVKHPIITAGFMKSAQAVNDKYKPDVVFSVASTMVMNHGLQLAFPDAEIHAVQVAGNSASQKWPGRAIIHEHDQPFNENVKDIDAPPFPSISTYDAKGWKYALKYKKDNPNKKVMFWNVAGEHKVEDVNV